MAFSAGPSVAGFGTTAAIDTTGYTLLIAATVGEGGHTLTDSKGNTWTSLTTYGTGSTYVRIHYCVSPTVGTGHTFTPSVGYRAVAAMAFTGQAATPFDQQNGASATSGSSLSTGSITPTENDELVFAAIGLSDTLTSISVNSGFTTDATRNSASGTNFGVGIGHIIQTTAGAVNPAWSWTGSTTQAGAAIASFKAAGGGGSATDLTIQDATHGHSADSLTLTLGYTNLTIADATHGHAADSLALTLDTTLAIADATHAHTADNLAISTSGAVNLTIQDATHAHTADSPTLTLGYTDLAIAEALHAHTADNLTLTVAGAVDLIIARAVHAHTVDSLTLTFPLGALSDAEFREMYEWVKELHRIHGLTPGVDLVVTPTSRTAGAISQTIGEVGTTITVARV